MVRKPTRREHALMIAAMLAAAGFGYAALRFQPLEAVYLDVVTRTQSAEEKFKKASAPRDEVLSAQPLQDQLAGLQNDVASMQQRLTELTGRFVPVEEPQWLQQLKLDISALANQTGVQVQENVAISRLDIPLLVNHAVAVGERSGSLVEVLHELSKFFDEDLQIRVKRMSTMVEPLMILIVGGMVGFVYIAFFQAIFLIAAT